MRWRNAFTLMGWLRQVYRRVFGYRCPTGWCGGRVKRATKADVEFLPNLIWWGCVNCNFGYWGRK
jgi:hypothetical protein